MNSSLWLAGSWVNSAGRRGFVFASSLTFPGFWHFQMIHVLVSILASYFGWNKLVKRFSWPESFFFAKQIFSAEKTLPSSTQNNQQGQTPAAPQVLLHPSSVLWPAQEQVFRVERCEVLQLKLISHAHRKIQVNWNVSQIGVYFSKLFWSKQTLIPFGNVRILES